MPGRLDSRARGAALFGSAFLLVAFAALFIVAMVTMKRVEPYSVAPQEKTRKSDRQPLRFGKTPSVSARTTYEHYTDMVELLNEKLDCCTIELIITPDYDSCIHMLQQGEIDIAWLGTVPYIRYRKQIPMLPLVRPLWAGGPQYGGVIFVLYDTEIESLNDLKGRKIAFVDPNSASGYVYPRALLEQNGIVPEQDLASMDFLGSHDEVINAVLLGTHDAGAVYEHALDSVLDRRTLIKLRVIARTAPIPDEPIVVKPDLDPVIVNQIRQAFLSLPMDRLEAEGLQELFGFIPARDEDYANIQLPGEK